MQSHIYRLLFLLLLISLYSPISAQTITGVWRGKINGKQAEVKMVKSGDAIMGVAYYYQKKGQYTRYSLKGHFDPNTNSVIWWDEALLDEYAKSGLLPQLKPDAGAQLMVADFNCPGGDEMYLDGSSSRRDDKQQQTGEIHLQKMDKPVFSDEWDFIIQNYFVGANDPQLIDSVAKLTARIEPPEEKPLTAAAPTPPPGAPPPTPSPLIEQKFTSRKNVLQTVIPITAKTIELRFYDNAQVDGDSIALFLNGRLLIKNIRLTEQAYTVTLQAAELQADNELVMVAENLGEIPPNTSYMVAVVGNKRYEARLYANEQSSAMIRLVNPELIKE